MATVRVQLPKSCKAHPVFNVAALQHFHEDVSLRGRPEEPQPQFWFWTARRDTSSKRFCQNECSKEKFSIWTSGLVTTSLPGSRKPMCLMSLVHRLFHYKNFSRPKGGGDNVTASQLML